MVPISLVRKMCLLPFLIYLVAYCAAAVGVAAISALMLTAAVLWELCLMPINSSNFMSAVDMTAVSSGYLSCYCMPLLMWRQCLVPFLSCSCVADAGVAAVSVVHLI